ncbi:hypothetical protein AB0958_42885 [Streptomyces sp. NPDC006655]|uniref:hypothetical protein n=1 Tax=Streptomyces sp. NPDC006655 TaxID=3156898 RepID=UPI003452D1F5
MPCPAPQSRAPSQVAGRPPVVRSASSKPVRQRAGSGRVPPTGPIRRARPEREQNMGLYDVAVTHTLKKTSAGYFVIADSGC